MLDNKLSRLCLENWHLVCHRCQIGQPGDFVKLSWLDREIVAFNDHDEVLLFDNLCPHRGARIFVEDEGNQRLRCNYHGWSYNSGKFSAPFPMQIPKDELARARFNTLQQAWCGDFLFAGVAPISSLSDQLNGLTDLLTRISWSIKERYDSEVINWESDWRIALENALEQYHTAVGLVHPESFGMHKTSVGFDEYFGRNSVYRCEYLDGKTNRQLQGLARYFDLAYQHPGYLSIHLFPFAMIGSTYGYSYSIQHFLPAQTPNVTNFSTRMLTSKLKSEAKRGILDPFFQSSMAINRKIFEEDHAICKRVSPHSLLPAFHPIFAESEAKIARFRQNLLRSD